MALGWLYVLSNEAMPGLVKIGQSAMDPHHRASELQSTGVPFPFVMEYKALFDDFSALERKVHRDLDDARIRSNREFFRLTVLEAVAAIRRAAGSPAKYEEEFFQLGAAHPEKPYRSTKIKFINTEAGYAWVTATEADFEVSQGLSRDLRKGYSIPPECPSCRRCTNSPSATGLFKFVCNGCGEAWVQVVAGGI